MASALRSLPLLLFVTAACSQLIGLGDLDKTDQEDSTDAPEAGTDSGGSAHGGTAGRPPNGGSSHSGASRGGAPGGNAGVGGTTVTVGGAGATGSDGGAGAAALAGAGGTHAGGANEGGFGGSMAGLGGGGAGGSCSTRELLVDGNFDTGSSAWKMGPTSTDGSPPIQATPYHLTTPNTAWLGRADAPPSSDFYEVDLYQAVTIPENTVQLEAQCQARVHTSDPTDENYDEAYLFLSDLSTVALDPILVVDVVDNLSVTGAWFSFGGTLSTPELEEYELAGAEVAFNLYSANDEASPTDFFVDNCSLVATVCE